ncbi:hypothetical protein MFIFM68171_04649 [Madurella fahalii]|uniref:Alpha and gamma adaptin binding protein p34 n=1 Tax=Madurella fahalii TaxID=1157608 RepID=A0ABQ0G9K2_9PEZI
MSSEKPKTDISNPRRILAVSLVDSAQHLSDVIKDLTGTAPSQPSDPLDALAGTTHPLALRTAYYTATVPVWLDLVASPAEWAATFLSAEAREVLAVLGGVVVVFPLVSAAASSPVPRSSPPRSGRQAARELVEHVGRVVKEGLGGWEWDGVSLAVGVGVGAGDDDNGDDDGGGGEEMDEWEDWCAEWGMEFVYLSPKGRSREADVLRNEFGEKMGLARIREALEANDWSGGGGGGGVDGALGDDDDGEEEEQGAVKGKEKQKKEEGEEDYEFDPESLDFGFDREDFVGLKKAIWAGGSGGTGEGSKDDDEEKLDEEEVRKLERMMLKLQAVRDASTGLPEEQRKRMAKQAVGEVMKEL